MTTSPVHTQKKKIKKRGGEALWDGHDIFVLGGIHNKVHPTSPKTFIRFFDVYVSAPFVVHLLCKHVHGQGKHVKLKQKKLYLMLCVISTLI